MKSTKATPKSRIKRMAFEEKANTQKHFHNYLTESKTNYMHRPPRKGSLGGEENYRLIKTPTKLVHNQRAQTTAMGIPFYSEYEYGPSPIGIGNDSFPFSETEFTPSRVYKTNTFLSNKPFSIHNLPRRELFFENQQPYSFEPFRVEIPSEINDLINKEKQLNDETQQFINSVIKKTTMLMKIKTKLKRNVAEKIEAKNKEKAKRDFKNIYPKMHFGNKVEYLVTFKKTVTQKQMKELLNFSTNLNGLISHFSRFESQLKFVFSLFSDIFPKITEDLQKLSILESQVGQAKQKKRVDEIIIHSYCSQVFDLFEKYDVDCENIFSKLLEFMRSKEISRNPEFLLHSTDFLFSLIKSSDFFMHHRDDIEYGVHKIVFSLLFRSIFTSLLSNFIVNDICKTSENQKEKKYKKIWENILLHFPIEFRYSAVKSVFQRLQGIIPSDIQYEAEQILQKMEKKARGKCIQLIIYHIDSTLSEEFVANELDNKNSELQSNFNKCLDYGKQILGDFLELFDIEFVIYIVNFYEFSLNQSTEVAHALFHLFESMNMDFALTKMVVAQRVMLLTSPSSFYIIDSVSLEIVSLFVFFHGKDYLSQTFGGLITEICDDDEMEFEMNPYKAHNPAAISRNESNLRKYFHLFANAIFQNISLIPSNIRSLCSYLNDLLVQRFPDNACQVVGGLIIQNFICVSLENPQRFHLYQKLVILAKFLDHLSRGVTFRQSKKYLQKFNLDLIQRFPECINFVAAIYIEEESDSLIEETLTKEQIVEIDALFSEIALVILTSLKLPVNFNSSLGEHFVRRIYYELEVLLRDLSIFNTQLSALETRSLESRLSSEQTKKITIKKQLSEQESAETKWDKIIHKPILLQGTAFISELSGKKRTSAKKRWLVLKQNLLAFFDANIITKHNLENCAPIKIIAITSDLRILTGRERLDKKKKNSFEIVLDQNKTFSISFTDYSLLINWLHLLKSIQKVY
eukprot:Anaeramoba_ignava/c18238_g1_i3.p1 GENE.c18238_g1_i3~~c18238_g1_i3.p1  ORF type:complete len:971 (-),score=286.96 c18238_g1_i3:171-3083(-)